MMNRRSSPAFVAGEMQDGAVVSDSRRAGEGFCLPYGFSSMPDDNQQVVLIEVAQQQLCCGVLHQPTVQKGEVCLRSSGGAFILLGMDGRVTINGLCISPQGEFIPTTKKEEV